MGEKTSGRGTAGGGPGLSSWEESPAIIETGVGDCVALAFPLKSLDPRDRDRDRERRLERVCVAGDVARCSVSAGPSVSASASGSGSVSTGGGGGSGSSVFSSCGGGVSVSSFFSSSVGAFSPSLTASGCIGGRRPSFIRGSEAALLSLATASIRCSDGEGSMPVQSKLWAGVGGHRLTDGTWSKWR